MEKKEFDLVIKGINKSVDNNELYINDKRIKNIIGDMLKQLDVIEQSLSSISGVIEKSLNMDLANKNRSEAFKELKKKIKFQLDSTKKLSDLLSKNYNTDLNNYPLKLLNDRIAEVERRISELSQ